MIHHAILGSLERFAAILLEHYGGQLPLWLAPEQVVVAPVGNPQIEYARRVAVEFESRDLRVVLDERSESLSRRIVYARERGIPIFVADNGTSSMVVALDFGRPRSLAYLRAPAVAYLFK